jgi:decaprenylphospho-beta-D-ribofuranose 2-oxidase
MSNKSNISNWGNYPSVTADVIETNDIELLKKKIQETHSILARGNGRSYGDASLNEVVFSTKRLNNIYFIDAEKATIKCDAGVDLATILEKIIPKGLFLEVTPGTKFITVGGAIAADVHGKNHHHKGCFSQQLISLTLLTEKGEVKTCSKEENKELFFQTIGGMGLTGIILTAHFKLKRITSSFISYQNQCASDLNELIAFFHKHKDQPYSVAWIDCLAKGSKKGRGVFTSGKHIEHVDLPIKLTNKPLNYQPKFKFKIGFNFPSFVLSTFTIKLFNKYFFAKNKRKKAAGITTVDSFFYPLDSIKNWNKIYGKNGFIQYQCVLPIGTSQVGLEKILDIVSQHSTPPFLTVLKLLGEANKESPWSFPMEGFTIAMDFKIHKGIEALIQNLDNIVNEYDGRVYLAKDAMSSKDVIVKPTITSSKFSSVQSKRLS